MKRHLENECPKGQQECPKCHGIYKASDDSHCCVSHLYKLIMVNKEIASDDRTQVNEGFQQLNQSVQHSIQSLNSKFKASLDEITTAVRTFASIQSQAAEFSA